MIKRIFAIIFIFLSCSIFVFYRYFVKQTNQILKIITPTMFVVDLNNNKVADDNEFICINNLQSFHIDLSAGIPEFAKNLNLSIKDYIGVSYLADEFSNFYLLNKSVKLKFYEKQSPNCRFADVIVGDDNYSDVLFNEGFAFKNGKLNNDKFKENLEKAKHLKLAILNLKSNKYHKLDCEYGLKSSDYTVVLDKQLPKDSMPCKFCHLNNSKNNKIKSDNFVSKKDYKISSGDLKIIMTDFTTKLDVDNSCKSQVCRELLNNINSAKTSIDMAIYGFGNIPEIYNAILKAKSRGVRFRLVYDSVSNPKNYYYPDTKLLVNIADASKSDYVEHDSLYTNKLMHNKFIIFDNKIVYTGSMNLSPTGLSGFNANTVLIINSPQIADFYTKEFEQMLSGKFHDKKLKLQQNSFVLSSTPIKVYFSPQDTPVKDIVYLINNAKKYIYMPIFLITDKDISAALVKAKNRGVDIKIIMDANNVYTTHSKHSYLRSNNIKLKTENYAGKMHSKTIIIDDRYLVIGSMNFSNSGANKNDENVVILENSDLAKYYKDFFLYLWAKIPDKYLSKTLRAESKDSIGSCSDGIDNNFDGKIDKNDVGCQ